MTVRYRGAAPDWSGARGDRARRRRARARPACVVDDGVDLGGDGRRRSVAAPSWSRSPTSRRRCRSCSARRWRHERRPPELARRRREIRERGRSRAFLVSLALMLIVGRGSHRPPGAARHRPGHQGRRPHRLDPDGAASRPRSTRRRRRHHDPHPPLRLRRRGRGRRSATATSTCSSSTAAVSSGSGDADEQLQAIVTGAIQLAAIRDRAAAAGHRPRRAVGHGRAGAGHQRGARPGGRAQSRRRDRRRSS